MSDLKSKADGVRFEPVTGPAKPLIGLGYLIAGGIYPAGVIAFEVSTRFCAQALFDPIPTVWHLLAVAFVPAMTIAGWARFEHAGAREARWLAFGTGIAAAIAVPYGLLFVPLVPLALFALVFYGAGLLPLAPVAAAVVAASLLWLMIARRPLLRLFKPGMLGLFAGLAAMIAAELPMAATRYGVRLAADSDPSLRAQGVSLLQTLGDDDLLLRLCYGTNGRPSGPLGMMMILSESGLFARPVRETTVAPAVAREIYYRVHGWAFNAVRAPEAIGRPGEAEAFTFDADLGGAQVGGRIQGLSLTSSRIDGSIAADDAVAYLEWTLEFQNTSPMDREARLELALPPGAVVSRATLWVNGEEREAAYGGRGQVRAAYEKVAVQQRRDPLLVTTKGGDRVLAQAFPVARLGGTIKFKLGLSAPVELTGETTGRLVMPAIYDRNFSISGTTSHAIWIDSKTQVTVGAPGLQATAGGPALYRVSGVIGDGDLTRTRQVIEVARTANAGLRIARLGNGDAVAQEFKVRQAGADGGALMVVVDGSAMLSGKSGEIARALTAIPAGTKVGVLIAAEPAVRLAIAPWSGERLAAASAMLTGHRFSGGQDNTVALTDALLALEGEPAGSRVLWIHGPQPQAFASGTARLEQAASRLGVRAAALTLYAAGAGPNGLLPDVAWAWQGRLLPQVSGIRSDLGGYLGGGGGIVAERRPANDAELSTVHAKGSEHIARLWVHERITAMMKAAAGSPRQEEQRLAAVALATDARLVTPVSGAVVLETMRQYEESGLTPAGQATVPTVPEPHEWVLTGIAGLMLIWLTGRRRTVKGVAL